MNGAFLLNELDIFIVISFAVIVFISVRRGFFLTLFSLSSCVIAILITNAAYPSIGGYLRGNDLVYLGVLNIVKENLSPGQGQEQADKKTQNQMIEELRLPGVITSSLIENNNPEVYELIGAASPDEYIAKVITEIIINIIAMALAFTAASLILSFVKKGLCAASRLPVIKTFNRAGGFILGVLLWLVFVWIVLAASFLFFPQYHTRLSALIETSVAAKYLFEYNTFLRAALNLSRRF